MYDCSKKILNFHNDYIRLTRNQQSAMRDRRNVNRGRIVAGLADLGKPAAVEWITQGGYAMKTMTQPPESDVESRYDIDMSVVFDSADSKTPRTTKGWVRDAIGRKAGNLKNEPEAKPKCVRVVYAEGYQCDFAVLRRTTNGNITTHEIAINNDWIVTDPKSMNQWFEDEIRARSPDEGNNGFQLRRIARYVKYFCKVHGHRRRLKFPAGLVATALAVECYRPVPDRDDEAIRETLRAISQRSEYTPAFANGMQVSDQKDIDRIRRLIDEARDAVAYLDELEGDNVTEADARKAWKKVFRHSYFDAAAQSAGRAEAAAVAAPTVLSTVVAALSEEEKALRADAAVQAIRDSGTSTRPWAS